MSSRKPLTMNDLPDGRETANETDFEMVDLTDANAQAPVSPLVDLTNMPSAYVPPAKPDEKS